MPPATVWSSEDVFVIKAFGSDDSFYRSSFPIVGLRVNNVRARRFGESVGEGRFSAVTVAVVDPPSWLTRQMAPNDEGKYTLRFTEVELKPDRKIWIVPLEE